MREQADQAAPFCCRVATKSDGGGGDTTSSASDDGDDGDWDGGGCARLASTCCRMLRSNAVGRITRRARVDIASMRAASACAAVCDTGRSRSRR